MTALSLPEFLLARIAEDEAEVGTKHDIAYDDGRFGDCGCGYPARVLAECEAKRRIVEEATGQHTSSDEGYSILEIMATVYAGHPDYRDEWKP